VGGRRFDCQPGETVKDFTTRIISTQKRHPCVVLLHGEWKEARVIARAGSLQMRLFAPESRFAPTGQRSCAEVYATRHIQLVNV